ncbi:CFA/I fimbrial subunit E [Pandoraea fibrosis]|uniref:CFA/I fimbrial subunit E n=2 Tax=Pandoraea fibrosis TaxID=1891094 RepID=A0A5E4SQC5_9BURK|nr:CFA/I fimbrial subunit E [Pandoraea fibrosis]
MGVDETVDRGNVLLCKSDVDPKFGACATKAVWSARDRTEIALLFTEARSHAQIALKVFGFRNNFSEFPEQALHSAVHSTGERAPAVTVWIESGELRKLPSGGIWKATLKLNQQNWHQSPGQALAESTVEFTLRVTDTKNIQIFLPEHNTTTPTVDLGLIGQVSRDGRTTGRRNIDMCLYDGFGAHSSRFDVTIKDGLTVPQRAPENFSVVRDGTSGQSPRERIDYRVTYVHNGQRKTFINGETVSLPGGNNAEVRSVYLPNIPVPVMCKPMPLTLETPEFNAKEKAAGSYTGRLKIIFSPSAQSL